MAVFTKQAVDVFNPVDALGNARGAIMGEAQTWGSEIEALMVGDPNRVGTPYTFSIATNTSVDPGAGKIALNNADLSLVTEIAISTVDSNWLATASWIAGFDDSSTLLNRGAFIFRKLDAAADALYRIVGASIEAAAFVRLAVSYREHTGTFANAAALGALFIPTGDRGGNNYELGVWLPGDALPAGGEVLLRHGFKTSVLYAANLVGWQISSKVAAPEAAVYTLWKMADINDLVGTQLGTATIALGAKVATFSSAEITYLDGEYLELRAPDPPVANLSDLTVTAVGTQVLP